MPQNKTVKDLRPHPFNISIYGEPDHDLTDSLKQFGLLRPVEITANNLILSGARRWRAAKELGWKEIETNIIPLEDDAEEKKFVLLANAYRSAKTLFVRQREADAYRDFLETDEVTVEELATIARRHGKEPVTERHFQPAELAPRAAGISRSTYRRAKYVTEPKLGETEIDQYKREGRISSGQAGHLKRELRQDREKFQRDRITPQDAYRSAKSRLRDAEREHGYSPDDLRRMATEEFVEDAIRRGNKFAESLHMLQHKARVQYLTAKHAFRLAGLLVEIRDATRSLMGKAEIDFDAAEGELPSDEARRLIEA